MNASFEEKSTWITLASLIVVFGGYFVVAGRMLAAGVDEMIAFVPLLALVTVLLVVVLSGGHAVAALLRRPEPPDERDRIIGWRAEYRSSWVLGVGVLAAVFALALPIARVWIAHGLLASIFLSEVLEKSLRLIDYRRGI